VKSRVTFVAYCMGSLRVNRRGGKSLLVMPSCHLHRQEDSIDEEEGRGL
jgi:hypothetical protein